MKKFTTLSVQWPLPLSGLLVLLLFSCSKDFDHKDWGKHYPQHAVCKGDVNSPACPDMIYRWTDAAVYVTEHTPQPPPITPFFTSRYYAMVSLAMHDALNNILPRYQTYALKNAKDKDADPAAAVAQAAHDVIAASFNTLNPPIETPPEVKDYIANLLTQSLSGINDGVGKTKGIALGKAAAKAVIQKRSADGSQTISFTFPEGTKPGQYRYTPPFNIPDLPIYGTVDAVGWDKVTPFSLVKGSQFRPEPPYGKANLKEAIKTKQYIADYNEIKDYGGVVSSKRTADQTNLAKFWVEGSPEGWHKVARAVSAQKSPDMWAAARLFALVHMAISDAYIGSADAKMYYYFWRPVTAITLNNLGHSPGTIGDPTWDVLVFPTPPIPDYPSAHATAGGAAAQTLIDFFGKDNFSFTLSSPTADPSNPTRKFRSISDAARENTISRMYVGYHFRNTCLAGEAQGKKIGRWVAGHALREN